MSTNVQTYLFFGGHCEEALEFYRTAVGAEVEFMMRFNEGPQPPAPGTIPPGFEKKIMHATFRIGETKVMASDGNEAGLKFEGFSLSLSVATKEEADRAFGALATGGKIDLPIGKTFWSPWFGMVTDKFGVGWMVGVTSPTP